MIDREAADYRLMPSLTGAWYEPIALVSKLAYEARAMAAELEAVDHFIEVKHSRATSSLLERT